ncbi:MAG: 4Fe-4S ferredoxin [Dehalococcoidia bacterium]|nr:4Fe-4S ferredoxin [Dehalococcoidia bacterium]MSQ16599.1 4Fe-4S ferredoxin [Dehalococcoidia bacterium]
MNLTRRNFLTWAGISAAGAVSCNIPFPEAELKIQSPVRLPEDLVKGQDNWYATLCRQCPAAEGVLVRVMEGRAKKVQGNPKYPVNLGKQSARCDAGLQALYHPDRLAGPMSRTGAKGSGQYKAVSWDEALNILNSQLSERGQGLALITEPLRAHLSVIAGRFATAFGGRQLGFQTLDDTSYRGAVKTVFGQDVLPGFDLAHADYLLSFGADFLSTWGSPTQFSQAYGEFRQGAGRVRRGTHVQVEPRFSMTAANADRWLPITPGWEGHLAMSLAYVIIDEKLQAPGVDVGNLTGGRGIAALEAFRPETVAPRIGLPQGLLDGHSAADFIRELARDFASHRPSLAIGGDSAGAHSNGQFNLEAIYALNYLVGSVGAPGGVVFNAASPLPDLPAAAKVGSLADWAGVAEDIRSGKTKLLLVHQADPVHGLPKSMGFRDALAGDNLFTVSFSSFMDETTALADLILPDRVYLEDWGSDIPEPGPGYPVLGFQQPVVNPLSDYNPRSFADILLASAQGKAGNLPWPKLRDFLRESSDALFALKRGSIQAADSGEFWTKLLQQGGWWDDKATNPRPGAAPRDLLTGIAARAVPPAYSGLADGEFHLLPFAHNTLLDGGNAHLPWLQGAPDPVTTITWQTWVEVNDRKVKELKWREGDVIKVESAAGFILAPVYPNPALPPNVVAIPLGQGRRSGGEYAAGRAAPESANVMDLLEDRRVAVSGALAWAGARVRLTPTGESIRISKFEGSSPAREIGLTPSEDIFKTVESNGAAGAAH